ncbi:MAG: hypothetical protein AABX04_00990 [Nanoarchaeota archaeon]
MKLKALCPNCNKYSYVPKPKPIFYDCFVFGKYPVYKINWNCCSSKCKKEYLLKWKLEMLDGYICDSCRKKMGPVWFKESQEEQFITRKNKIDIIHRRTIKDGRLISFNLCKNCSKHPICIIDERYRRDSKKLFRKTKKDDIKTVLR